MSRGFSWTLVVIGLLILPLSYFLPYSAILHVPNTSLAMSSRTLNELTLEFSETSAREFVATAQDKSLSQHVRKVIVYTHPSPDFDMNNLPFSRGRDREDWVMTPIVPEVFEQALQDLVHFPHLHSFEMRFTKECAVRKPGERYYRQVPETKKYRISMLERVFKALDRVNKAGRPVVSLAIKNLQNTKIASVAESAEFKRVMAEVKELHLSICTEYDDASPESSIERPEYMNYPAELTTEWLDPVPAHLTHLSLYWDVFFGVIPTFPQSDAKPFPKLKSLTLGNYAFGSDMQMDWILGHADTLEELVMDENAITHHVVVYSEDEINDFRIKKHFKECSPSVAGRRILCKYDKQWHEYFDALRGGLPHLRRFRFGSNWHALPGTVNEAHGHEFEHRDRVKTELFPGRYVIFDSGIGPTQWLTSEEDGSYPDTFPDAEVMSPAVECHGKDQEALGKLLEAVDARDAALGTSPK